MPNQTASFAAVVAGGVLAYSAFNHKRVIDVLLMRDSTLPSAAGQNVGVDPNNSTIYGDPTTRNGTRAEIRAVALKACSMPGGTYQYAEIRPYPKSLFSGNRPIRTDCSGFVTLCYKEAGAKDPNGLGYSGAGYTGTLEGHGRKTTQPQPGDLCFWSSPDHVALYLGGGQCASFGSNPGPRNLSIAAEAGYHTAFLGYRSYL